MIAEEVDDEDEGKQQQKKAAAAEQAQRSTGPVDRRAQHARGWSSVDRPVDRLKVPNSLLGTRSTDKRVRAETADLETVLYKYGFFLGFG